MYMLIYRKKVPMDMMNRFPYSKEQVMGSAAFYYRSNVV